MSVTIRLERTGRKNLPSFRVVLTKTKGKRDGRPLETLGTYNPSENPVVLTLKKEEIQAHVKNGALISKAVKDLLEGKYTFKPYRKKGVAEDEAKTESAEESPATTEA